MYGNITIYGTGGGGKGGRGNKRGRGGAHRHQKSLAEVSIKYK